METCGQCPGAESPDLLLGRSRKCCDEGKVMYLSLVCVCGGEQCCTPGMHSSSPGTCGGQGPISSVLLSLSGPVSCEYPLPAPGFVRAERLKYPKSRPAELCAADLV